MSLIKRTKNKIKRKFPWIVDLLTKVPFLKREHVFIPKTLDISTLITDQNLIDWSKLKFKAVQNPDVSIIIAIHNHWPHTINLLSSLASHATKYSFEVIIVNDCSSDESAFLLSKIPNIKVIDNEVNLGFLKSCNLAAKEAQSRYLVMLNNDTQPQTLWLDTLVDTLEKDESIGLAGSMLIYPNGQLQESGGIIWANASGHNYGRLRNRDYPQYNYLRKTDYCSGASIIISRALFEGLQQFDELYAPAYYEDTDLAMKVRASGKKVVVQPASKIIHFEGISSGTDTQSGVKQYQVVNKEKFRQKWENELLEQHFNEQNERPIESIIKNNGRKVILIADYWVPLYNQNSGSNRLFHIIKILRRLDYYIIFLPDDGAYMLPYTKDLQQLGVHVLYNNVDKKAIEHLDELLPYIEVAWLCNPVITEKYFKLVKKGNPKAKILYDTIDLHYVRMRREAELQGKGNEAWEKMHITEKFLAQNADTVIAVSEEEATKLKDLTEKKIVTIPNIHKYVGSEKGFDERQGLLFIGGYHHMPNVDAAHWLIKEIMPLVWKKNPEVHLTLLGSNPTEELLAYAKDPRVHVPGFIADISGYFDQNKIFISPLRYGAGMKGKIGQALEHGLPIVSTAIGIEGMFLVDGEHVLQADTAQVFAEKIIELYQNESLWYKLKYNAEEALEPFSIASVEQRLEKILSTL